MSKKSKALEFADETYNINVQGRHVEVTDAMKDYVVEKISRIERIIDRIIDVHVIMDIQKVQNTVEIVALINNQKILAKYSCDDMYKSIDKAVDILLEQLRRYKEKIRDHHVMTPKREMEQMTVNVLRLREEELQDVNDEIEEETERRLMRDYSHDVVSQETLTVKTLNQSEAVQHMRVTKDRFMIYRDEVDHRIKIIYLRDDGDYGVIEPQA